MRVSNQLEKPAQDLGETANILVKKYIKDENPYNYSNVWNSKNALDSKIETLMRIINNQLQYNERFQNYGQYLLFIRKMFEKGVLIRNIQAEAADESNS